MKSIIKNNLLYPACLNCENELVVDMVYDTYPETYTYKCYKCGYIESSETNYPISIKDYETLIKTNLRSSG